MPDRPCLRGSGFFSAVWCSQSYDGNLSDRACRVQVCLGVVVKLT
jgi:hypothetical protein